MSTHFPNYPHLYDPPGDVVRLLRDVDPAADLLYGGWGTWMLVRYRPNAEHTARAIRALIGQRNAQGGRDPGALELLEKWHQVPRYRENPAAYRRLYQRFLYFTAIRLGARPIMQYDWRYLRALGFSAIVADFRQAEWRLHHTTDDQVQRELTADQDAARATAQNELRDEHAAVTMANHLARNPHSVTAAAPDIGRSGFTRTSSTSLVRSA